MASSSSLTPESTNNASTTMDQIQTTANHLWSSMTLRSDSGERESQSSSQAGDMKATAENVLRVMFGACTTGGTANNLAGEIDDDDEDSPKNSKSTCEPASPDVLFPKNYSEQQALAALNHMKERRLMMEKKSSPGAKLPGFFPMSAPSKDATTTSLQPGEVSHLRPAETFDDGVSAISAHTLEEMAMAYQPMDGFARIRSDLTQDPKVKQEESWKQTVTRRGGRFPESNMSPLRFGRDGRSTKSRFSHQTKDTMSTATEEFANMFRKEEAAYWNEIVEEQEIIKKPKDLLTLGRDGTITTVPSDSCSGANTPYLLSKTLDTDPDRLVDVLVMPPGTEMAEI